MLLAGLATLAGCGERARRSRQTPETTLSAPAPPPAPPPAHAGPTRFANGEITNGPRTRQWVALTFDADMTEGMLALLHSRRVASFYDASIVRLVRDKRTPATVFLTGLWARTYPDVVRSLARDPLFELENHSWDHGSFAGDCYGLPHVPAARKRFEVTAPIPVIRSLSGSAPRYFRFPGGCHSAGDVRLAQAAGEQPVGWDVVSGDPFQPSPEPIVHAVLAGARPGSIIVMHLMGPPNAPATARALPRIIDGLRARGLQFVTLRQLLGG